jgi:hypothetical protein
MLVPARDMPRTKDGTVPDMIMNPHAIPSRMTMGQLLETILGKAAAVAGAIGNATSFMNDGDPTENIGAILESKGYEKYGNEILYDGTSGIQIPSVIFIGHCYTMRLKHMTQDKWNARAQGRKEARTHQPTGGRGNQGGLRIGEMERDAISGHGTADFLQESFMKRSDATEFIVCNGCGTVPIYNESENLYFCTLCDGPAYFSGSKPDDLTLVPPNKRSTVKFSKVAMPYASYLLTQELTTYMNMSLRFLTAANVERLEQPSGEYLSGKGLTGEAVTLRPLTIPETSVPALVNTNEGIDYTAGDDEERALVGFQQSLNEREAIESAAIDAAVNAQAQAAKLGLSPEGVTATIRVENAPAATSPFVPPGPNVFQTTPSPAFSPQVTNVPVMYGAPNGAVYTNAPVNAGPPPPPAPVQTYTLTNTTEMTPGGTAPVASGGFQQLAQRQITETYAPPPEAQIYPPVLPGAPANIVVATDPASMMAAGLRPLPTGAPLRAFSAPRPVSNGETNTNSPSNASARVTVIKQG